MSRNLLLLHAVTSKERRTLVIALDLTANLMLHGSSRSSCHPTRQAWLQRVCEPLLSKSVEVDTFDHHKDRGTAPRRAVSGKSTYVSQREVSMD